MNAQLDAVYDYMIKNKKYLHKPIPLIKSKAKLERLLINEHTLGKIYFELSNKKGALTRFAELMVREGIFANKRGALQALRLYGSNNGTTKTDEKRERIISLYHLWDGKTYTKDIEKWNKKLSEYWSTQWQH